MDFLLYNKNLEIEAKMFEEVKVIVKIVNE